MSVISVQNLTKKFGSKTAVSNLSFEVDEGEITGLLGPNGAGKTTTIKLLLNLIFPTEGKTCIFGKDSGDPKARERVGYVPENASVHRFLTADEFLRFHARLYGIDQKNPISEILSLVGLSSERNRRIGGFSKGMLQRLLLAQALISSPDLLILDEPTSGLDPIGRKEIREIILEQKKKRKTVFLSSHLLSEVELTCDKVLILKNGVLAKSGKIQDLTQIKETIRIQVSEIKENFLQELKKILEETSIQVNHEKNEVIFDAKGEDISLQITKVANETGVRLLALYVEKESLEDLFVRTVRDSDL